MPLPVPIKARPPTSATRQQQKIRMIKQCCAVFNRYIPATENTWRPRKEGESYEEYRLRVVERGDGDLFRAWQIQEAALRSRTDMLCRALEAGLDEASRRRLAAPGAAEVVRDRAGRPWAVYQCEHCRMRAVVAGDALPARRLCDICEAVKADNDLWAPHMPCKAPSKKRKKKKKKKKRRADDDSAPPSAEQLLEIAAAAKRPRRHEERAPPQLSLGMDTKPEQTLRPALQNY